MKLCHLILFCLINLAGLQWANAANTQCLKNLSQEAQSKKTNFGDNYFVESVEIDWIKGRVILGETIQTSPLNLSFDPNSTIAHVILNKKSELYRVRFVKNRKATDIELNPDGTISKIKNFRLPFLFSGHFTYEDLFLNEQFNTVDNNDNPVAVDIKFDFTGDMQWDESKGGFAPEISELTFDYSQKGQPQISVRKFKADSFFNTPGKANVWRYKEVNKIRWAQSETDFSVQWDDHYMDNLISMGLVLGSITSKMELIKSQKIGQLHSVDSDIDQEDIDLAKTIIQGIPEDLLKNTSAENIDALTDQILTNFSDDSLKDLTKDSIYFKTFSADKIRHFIKETNLIQDQLREKMQSENQQILAFSILEFLPKILKDSQLIIEKTISEYNAQLQNRYIISYPKDAVTSFVVKKETSATGSDDKIEDIFEYALKDELEGVYTFSVKNSKRVKQKGRLTETEVGEMEYRFKKILGQLILLDSKIVTPNISPENEEILKNHMAVEFYTFKPDVNFFIPQEQLNFPFSEISSSDLEYQSYALPQAVNAIIDFKHHKNGNFKLVEKTDVLTENRNASDNYLMDYSPSTFHKFVEFYRPLTISAQEMVDFLIGDNTPRYNKILLNLNVQTRDEALESIENQYGTFYNQFQQSKLKGQELLQWVIHHFGSKFLIVPDHQNIDAIDLYHLYNKNRDYLKQEIIKQLSLTGDYDRALEYALKFQRYSDKEMGVFNLSKVEFAFVTQFTPTFRLLFKSEELNEKFYNFHLNNLAQLFFTLEERNTMSNKQMLDHIRKEIYSAFPELKGKKPKNKGELMDISPALKKLFYQDYPSMIYIRYIPLIPILQSL